MTLRRHLPTPPLPPDAPSWAYDLPLSLTTGEVARLLGVCVPTVRRMVRRGELRARRTGGGHLRFARSVVVAYMIGADTDVR